ncbi:MAG: methyltransferase [Chryseolinea sp.]
MKSTSHFHFKQFSVRHDSSAMKVGTDAVLIGSWSNVGDAQSILDIGTGSGIIALMMAQRSSNTTRIDAVEIDDREAAQAADNVSNSPWTNRVHVHTGSIQSFDPGRQYDVIISNPPYFIDSQKPPTQNRTMARHTTSLDYKELSHCVRRLLHTQGRFYIILPAAESTVFITTVRFDGLFCTKKVFFKTRNNKPVERMMMEFNLRPAQCEESELVLYEHGSTWTAEYRALTDDFYLEQNRV